MTKSQRENYLEKISILVLKIAPKYGVAKAAVFGSLVNGTFGNKSDIDLLVAFRSPIGFVEFIKLENELSSKLRKKVDLVTESSLSRYFRKDVLKEMRVVYEKKR